MNNHNIGAPMLWAAVALATVALLFYNVLPMYLGALQESTGLSSGQIGLVASAFFFGFNVVSFSSYFWVRKVAPFHISLLAALMLMALLWIAESSSSFAFQLLVTALIGGVSGIGSSVGVTIVGDADNCTRWYGIQVAAEAFAGVVLLFVLPVTLIPEYGFGGVILGMVAMILVLLPAFFFLTRTPLPIPIDDKGQDKSASAALGQAMELRSSIPARMALVAMLLLFVASAAIWAFVERIAAINNFNPESVGKMLGVTLFFAVIGSLIAGAVGDRFGNLWPYLINCFLLLAGVFAIALTDNFVVYSIGSCVFMFGWAAGFAFLFAIIADFDPDGRHIALSVPALGIGSMIGPGMAGYLLSGNSTLPIQIMSLGSILVSAVLAYVSTRSAHQG